LADGHTPLCYASTVGAMRLTQRAHDATMVYANQWLWQTCGNNMLCCLLFHLLFVLAFYLLTHTSQLV